MELEYSYYRNREGQFYRPTIEVTFKYGSKEFRAEEVLVDTGSDFVIINTEIADQIGAIPDKEMAIEIDCVCGKKVHIYHSLHPIEIVLPYENLKPTSWKTPVKIVDADSAPLLGQRGFLNHFDVTFYGKRHVMKIVEATS